AAVSLAAAMTEAGYEAQANPAEGEVTAYNCVFHRLASRFPEVCEYDLAFIRAVTGRSVDHTECMVRGGEACRFRLGGKLPSAKPDSGAEPSAWVDRGGVASPPPAHGTAARSPFRAYR